ncbi:MAG: bacillithiol biosynthesis cysteine-adding enzyme BshC [Bacteroidota bacterium]
MTESLPYCKTFYFSRLFQDYIDQKTSLTKLYNRFPHIDNFAQQLEEKQNSFSVERRKTLVEVLQHQYKNTAVSEATQFHFTNLTKENTFTVTTGHQLNIFTGPLYFLYKIVSAIELCRELKVHYPEHQFVPVYWMATEDHDFDEISFFNYRGKKWDWKQTQEGPVGRMSTKSLENTVNKLCESLGKSDAAEDLKTLFTKAYLQEHNLADATRILVNELFGDYGLVIIDGDDQSLKQQAIPHFEKELFHQQVEKNTQNANQYIQELGYSLQVNPREINLFYIKDGLRERIVSTESGGFAVVNTEITFSATEIQEELHQYPERFSPNVMMRPLYQEVVLPNLCYIGGGGELAYWLQLKDYFEAENIPFPTLLPRNSALLYTQKQAQKAKRLEVNITDLFLNTDELKTKLTHQLSTIEIDFSQQKKFLEQQFEDLYRIAQKTDASFEGAVAAQEQKQKNGLDHLEKRLRKAQKRKLADYLNRVEALQDELFPQKMLQERHANFMEFYEFTNGKLIPILFDSFQPLQMDFSLISLDR